RYRSFVSHHAPHVCEMRRSSRDAANAATRGKCCHLPVTPANIRACYRQEATARPGPATTGCQSLMLDAAEARHVATAGWSILPSRCDGRLRGQRLCVPGDGRGANMTGSGEAGFGRRSPGKRGAGIAVLAAASVLFSQAALADEGGVSFWLPGLFGSLAASPQQPGWSLTSIYYHTSVSAGADVAKAREFEIGRIPVNLTAN